MFTPLTDKILVKPAPDAEVTKSGLHLVSSVEQQMHTGEVIAVGPGKVTANGVTVPMAVTPGDTVLFSRFAGTKFKIGDVDHRLIREEELLAVIDDTVNIA